MDGSDTDCHKDIILRQMKQAITEALSLPSEERPKISVEEIRLLFAKWCNAKTEDTHSNAMTLNAFSVAVTELIQSIEAKHREEMEKVTMQKEYFSNQAQKNLSKFYEAEQTITQLRKEKLEGGK